MIRLTRILTLSLVLLVAATSQQMAVARAAMAEGGTQVTLCSGAQTLTVTLDRTGTPVDPVRVCPDCAVTLHDAIAPPDGAAPHPIYLATLAHWPVRPSNVRVMPNRPSARGPPIAA